MRCTSCSLKLISGSVAIVELKIIHQSSEHYTKGIISNVFSSSWHISHCRCTLISNWCSLHTRKGSGWTAIWTLAIGGGIRKISFLPLRQLCQSLLHPTRLTARIFRAISMPGRFIFHLVILERSSAVHLLRASEFSLGRSIFHRQVQNIVTRYGILRLELYCHHSGILR